MNDKELEELKERREELAYERYDKGWYSCCWQERARINGIIAHETK